MAEIVSGKSLKGIISNIKAFFKGVVTLGMIVNNLDDVLAVEEGTVLPVGCKALQEVSAKIQLLMYVKTDVKQLNAGNNSFIVEPPSVEGYKVVGLMCARVGSSDVIVKGIISRDSAGRVEIQNNANASEHNVMTSWLIQKTI